MRGFPATPAVPKSIKTQGTPQAQHQFDEEEGVTDLPQDHQDLQLNVYVIKLQLTMVYCGEIPKYTGDIQLYDFGGL